MSSEPETIPISHEYVTDASFAARAARSYTSFLLGRPQMILIMSILVLVGAACVVAGTVLNAVAFTLIGAIYLLVPLIFVPSVYLRTRSGNAKRVPEGSRFALGLGDRSMRLDSPLGSSQTNYRAYSAIYRSGDFAIMRLLGLRAYSILPMQLLPDGDFEKLRDAVQRAQKRP